VAPGKREDRVRPWLFYFEATRMQVRWRNIIIISMLIPFVLWAEDGRSGFDFLRWDMGARPASMGGAFTAVSGDLYGLRYNPASLVGSHNRDVSFTYLNHLFDINSGFVGFNQSIGRFGLMGLGVFYTHYGEMRRTDITGENLGSFAPMDLAVTMAVADSLPGGFQYGVSLEYIYSRIDSYSSSAIAGGVGLIYHIPSQNMNLGLSVTNAGGALSSFVKVKEKLPLTYRLGVSKHLAHLPLLLNFDLIRYQYEESGKLGGFYWALGGEFTLSESVYLRWGYNSRGSEEKVGATSDRFAGVCFGLGFRFEGYQVDYGFNAFGVLGARHFLTATIPLSR